MALQRCRAVFMRGGTSKALMFHEADLPAEPGARDALFLAAMGSPDPNGRQLDGMGGGISSLSKVCVVGPPSRDGADVDFTFAQIAVDAAAVDYAGTCGNMSSAIGPFAIDEGLVPAPPDGEASVRVHNTNTGKIFVARFPVADGRAVTEGALALDGVSGTGAPVRLDFLDPAGSKTGRLLPTGNPADTLDLPGIGALPVSMVDAANPCVFVAAASLDLAGTEMPDAIERDAGLLARLEAIRQHAAVAMGIAPDLAAAAAIRSIPKLGLVSAPREQRVLSGRVMPADETDILARVMSVGQPHRATPLTVALCLAVACRVPGSVPHRLARASDDAAPLRIGHPSGTMMVAATVERDGGTVQVPAATVFRTARRLFQGDVLYQVRSWKPSP